LSNSYKINANESSQTPAADDLSSFSGGTKIKQPAKSLPDRRFLVISFLVIFISFFLLQNNLFIIEDIGPRNTDHHIIRAIYYHDFLIHGNQRHISVIPYPPVVYLVTQPFFITGGISLNSARFSMSVFSIIFLLAMFGIGYELGGYCSGAAVMALAASSPFILSNSRGYFPDFPQTAVTALAFYLLLKTRGFLDRKFTILFWIVMTISFLTKWSTGFFMLVPILWFLIPNLFSKRSIIAFLAIIIPLTVSMIFFLKFYMDNYNYQPVGMWFFYYLLMAFLPALILAAAVFHLEKHWKENEDFIGSKVYGVINFGYGVAIFVILTCPWYFWTLWYLKRKFSSDLQTHHSFLQNLEFQKFFFGSILNFSPIFLALGLIFIFISRKDIYRRLVIPVNILLVSLLMLKIGYVSDRYILSLVIFAAALGGFWVIHTGKLKLIITGFIVAISLTTIFSWIIHLSDLPFLLPIGSYLGRPGSLQVSMAPIRNSFDITKAIESMQPSKNGAWKDIIVYEARGFQFDADELQLQAYSRGKRIRPAFQWDEDGKDFMKEQIEFIIENNYQRVQDVEGIYILHGKDQSSEPAKKEILRLFPDFSYNLKTIFVGEGSMLTIIKAQ